MDELLNELKLRIAAIEARLNRYESAVVPCLPPRPGSGMNPGAQYPHPESLKPEPLPTPPNHAGGNP